MTKPTTPVALPEGPLCSRRYPSWKGTIFKGASVVMLNKIHEGPIEMSCAIS